MNRRSLVMRLVRLSCLGVFVAGIAACEPMQMPGEQAVAPPECRDKICEGDIEPKRDVATEVAFKLNGQWYIGPKEYGNPNLGAIVFFWPSKAPGNDPYKVSTAKEVVKNKVGAIENFYAVAIEIFLRSSPIPPEPTGFQLIALAEKSGWIESRKTLRPGLDAIRMNHVLSPTGQYMDHVTYYVATQLKGTDNLPPVATCSHADPRNGGGTGFVWHSGIWVGIRMNQRHCADWPEIYLEITRVLQLLRKAQ